MALAVVRIDWNSDERRCDKCRYVKPNTRTILEVIDTSITVCMDCFHKRFKYGLIEVGTPMVDRDVFIRFLQQANISFHDEDEARGLLIRVPSWKKQFLFEKPEGGAFKDNRGGKFVICEDLKSSPTFEKEWSARQEIEKRIG